MNKHTLIDHHDIQKWVATQNGQPALSRFADSSGSMRSKLAINFAGRRKRPTATPGQDDGMAPCSWTAWLAELDRQNLALSVRDDDFEFVDRRTLN